MLGPAFFLKLLSLEGFHPVLDSCAACGSTDELVGFDLEVGGTLCRACSRRRSALSPEGLALVRRVLEGDLVGALNELPGPATAEVSRLATHALEQHIDRRLRSVGVL